MKNKIIEAKSDKKGPYIAEVFGVPVFGGRNSEVLKKITKAMNKKAYDKPFFVVTVNPEILMMTESDSAYKNVISGADLLVADGKGLRLMGLQNIYPGRNMVKDLLVINEYRVFYLGGKHGVVRLMAEKYGGEWDEGEKSIRLGERENIRILNKINKYRPDLLLVAYGAPWQERWIAQNIDKLKVKVVIGVGGTFDYLTGKTRLPPKWMEKLGLEWVWRLYQEPSRWRRQLNLIRFVWKVLVFKLK